MLVRGAIDQRPENLPGGTIDNEGFGQIGGTRTGGIGPVDLKLAARGTGIAEQKHIALGALIILHPVAAMAGHTQMIEPVCPRATVEPVKAEAAIEVVIAIAAKDLV